MSPSVLLPAAHLIGLDAVVPSPDAITLVVSTIQPAARCLACGEPATRVHSGDARAPADLPCGGLPVRLELHTRRFSCDTPDCPRRIFTERLPGLVLPNPRRTARLTGALEAIAHALGGEAGARLAPCLGMGTRAETLLRQLAERPPAVTAAAPRVLGVDDWAMRKGHQYGAILVDRERRCGVDLLPDRRPETLAVWL
jgi:transposase